MPFGKPLAIGAHHQRDMEPTRRLPTESSVDRKLPIRAIDEIVSPNDMVDLLLMIIDRHGELVGRWPIIPSYDEIPKGHFSIELLGTSIIVDPLHGSVAESKPPSVAVSLSVELTSVHGRTLSAATGIDNPIEERFVRCRRTSFDLRAAASTRID
jgi:hypothetical protein